LCVFCVDGETLIGKLGKYVEMFLCKEENDTYTSSLHRQKLLSCYAIVVGTYKVPYNREPFGT
jgi:hypothetical protein